MRSLAVPRSGARALRGRNRRPGPSPPRRRSESHTSRRAQRRRHRLRRAPPPRPRRARIFGTTNAAGRRPSVSRSASASAASRPATASSLPSSAASRARTLCAVAGSSSPWARRSIIQSETLLSEILFVAHDHAPSTARAVDRGEPRAQGAQPLADPRDGQTALGGHLLQGHAVDQVHDRDGLARRPPARVRPRTAGPTDPAPPFALDVAARGGDAPSASSSSGVSGRRRVVRRRLRHVLVAIPQQSADGVLGLQVVLVPQQLHEDVPAWRPRPAPRRATACGSASTHGPVPQIEAFDVDSQCALPSSIPQRHRRPAKCHHDLGAPFGMAAAAQFGQ